MHMNREEELRACIDYFMSTPGFKRLLEGMYEKFRSLGTVGGNVKLASLTEVEKDALEGLFQKSFRHQRSATISMEKLQSILQQSRFSRVNTEELLKGCFPGRLESKKEEALRESSEREHFFSDIYEKYKMTFSGSWLKDVLIDNGKERAFLIKKYNQSKKGLEKSLGYAMTAANAFPVFSDEVMHLPVFAAKMTGNPHCFDDGKEEHQLLIYLARYYLRLNPSAVKQEMVRGRYQTEEKNELFFRVGLIKEEMLNYTMAYGIRCRDKRGRFHQGIDGFCNERQPVLISLNTLAGMRSATSGGKPVYVLENAGVFESMLGRLPSDTSAALVCIGGQPHLASLVLLDLLSRQGCKMYYSGDFDPEGLRIAGSLKQRYGEGLTLWHYEESDFIRCLSQVHISNERMKKLDKLEDEKLIFIGELIRRYQKAGYQEGLIDLYLADMF